MVRIAFSLVAVFIFTSLHTSAVYGEDSTEGKSRIVVIDAGHQSRANTGMEPIGPGSKTRKFKVTGGTRGVVTGIPEYKIVLKVAKKLRKELESDGYTVYMVRTKNDVNIPNSARAKYANKKKADLFIRLHCDAAGDAQGVLTLTPKKNKWTKKIYRRSLKASKVIHKAVLKKTKARDRGVAKRGDLTGFNYSKVPVVLLELGVMTNAKEDRRLASSKYQKKLASGIATGVGRYFKALDKEKGAKAKKSPAKF
jgi:N-acetylmuramoyl-L-alanine amidase